MAKLSARGRLELCRLVKEIPVPGMPEIKRWQLYAFMSDGYVLQKLVIKDPTKRRTSYPWKKVCRLEADKQGQHKAWLLSRGYQELKPGTRLA